jgi:hypothetical protein
VPRHHAFASGNAKRGARLHTPRARASLSNTRQAKCIEGFGAHTGVGAHYFRGFVCALERSRGFDVRFVASLCSHTHVHARTHTDARKHVHARTHTDARKHAHARTQTHT